MLRRSQGIDSRVTLSQSEMRFVPPPSHLFPFKTAVLRVRLYVAPKG